MIFKNEKVYDLLKNMALLMPILTTLYGVIGKVWHIPYTTEIILTLGAINSALASIVKISKKKYDEIVAEFEAEEEKDYEVEEEEE